MSFFYKTLIFSFLIFFVLKISWAQIAVTPATTATFDNTQIIGTTYGAYTFYECSLPSYPEKISKPWVQVTFQSNIAVVQVKELGPQNFYDDYWDTSDTRQMNQNLPQWMPAVEWINGSTRVEAIDGGDPNFVGASSWYDTNPDTPPNNPYYPGYSAGKRFTVPGNPPLLISSQKTLLNNSSYWSKPKDAVIGVRHD